MTSVAHDASPRSRFLPARAAWRTLLVHVQPEPEALPRLTSAADLAGALDATLIGLAAEMLPPIAASDPTGLLGAQLVTALLETIRTNGESAADRFRRATSALRTEWVSAQAFPIHATCRMARSADLIVAGGSPLEHQDNYRWCDPAALALQAGRPVLVVPPAGGRLEARRAVVGWKDTREAGRAVIDELQLLLKAEEVTVVEIIERDSDRSAALQRVVDVSEWLRRHEIDSSYMVPNLRGDAVEELARHANDVEADIIVAGAYGHTRLREWCFGGVTRDLLSTSRRCAFLSR